MIIYLGRRLPDASSDLPGSRDGSGRSVGGGRWGTGGLNRLVPSRPFALPPYLVLLPMGFTEPGRSPGLLVSSYLAVSPLPRSGRGEATRPRRSIFCGTVPIRTAFADPDGGRYPPSRPVESGLSSVARPRTQAFRPVGFPPGHRARAQAPRRSSRPPRTLTSIIRVEVRSNNPRGQESWHARHDLTNILFIMVRRWRAEGVQTPRLQAEDAIRLPLKYSLVDPHWGTR
jgi:hypothetical protein